MTRDSDNKGGLHTWTGRGNRCEIADQFEGLSRRLCGGYRGARQLWMALCQFMAA